MAADIAKTCDGLQQDEDGKKEEMRKKCPKGHGLRLFVSPAKGSCDGCRSRVHVGMQMMDCRQCNWWLCGDCCPQALEEAKMPERSVLKPEQDSIGSARLDRAHDRKSVLQEKIQAREAELVNDTMLQQLKDELAAIQKEAGLECGSKDDRDEDDDDFGIDDEIGKKFKEIETGMREALSDEDRMSQDPRAEAETDAATIPWSPVFFLSDTGDVMTRHYSNYGSSLASSVADNEDSASVCSYSSASLQSGCGGSAASSSAPTHSNLRCEVCGAKKKQVCRHWQKACCTRPNCAFCHHEADGVITAQGPGDGTPYDPDAPKAQRHRKNEPSLYYKRATDLTPEMVMTLVHTLTEQDSNLSLCQAQPDGIQEVCTLLLTALENHCGQRELAVTVAYQCFETTRELCREMGSGDIWEMWYDILTKVVDGVLPPKPLSEAPEARVIQDRIWRPYFSGRRRPKLPDKSAKWWPRSVPPVPWRGVFDQFCWHLAFAQLAQFYPGPVRRSTHQYPISGFVHDYSIHLHNLAGHARAEERRQARKQAAQAAQATQQPAQQQAAQQQAAQQQAAQQQALQGGYPREAAGGEQQAEERRRAKAQARQQVAQANQQTMQQQASQGDGACEASGGEQQASGSQVAT